MYNKKLVANPKSVEEKSKELLSRLDKTDPKEIINFLRYSQEKGYWTTDLTEKSEARIRENLDLLSDFDLSMLAWVYGNGRSGSSELWTRLEREALHRIADRSLARVNFGRLITGFGEGNRGSETFWDRVQHVVAEALDDFNAEAIAYITNGLGKAIANGQQAQKLAIEGLKHGILRNFMDFSKTDLILTLQGLADLGIEDNKIWNTLANSFVSEIQNINPELLVTGLESFARADKGSVKTWREILQVAQNQLITFTPSQLATTGWAAAKIQYTDKGFWYVFTRMASSQLAKSEPKDVVKILFAANAAEIGNEAFIKEVFNAINNLKALQKLDAQGFSHLLWTLEKNSNLSRDQLNEINRLILEKRNSWNKRECEEFLLTLNGTQILSNDVRKAIESSI